MEVLRRLGLDPCAVVDRVGGSTPTLRDEAVQLAPYGCVWLTDTQRGD